MINTNMRKYTCYEINPKRDVYGQQNPYIRVGSRTVNISITIASQSIQDNVLYKDCQYIGLTMDKSITDMTVILYEDKRLKVLYVNKQGRYNQVYMTELA